MIYAARLYEDTVSEFYDDVCDDCGLQRDEDAGNTDDP